MKNISKENKRNKLDIILTDLQPMETPEIYTLIYFYDFLEKNKCIDKLKRINGDSEKGITNPRWHVAPLKYYILKDNNELRTISYINPVSMIEVCLYLEFYENELLNYINKDSFSVRKHRKRANLVFKKEKNNVVSYGYHKPIEKEASGDFYEIYPYSRLDYFYKSTEWFDLNRKYSHFGKIDYSKCFDSIYTHTYNWIIANNTIDAKEFNGKHFLSATDRLLQNMNMSITNGIVVGPEFSRMLSEIILQSIDREVTLSLAIMGYSRIDDYEVRRYVDDIFIFAKDEQIVVTVKSEISRIAEKYNLRLNHEKIEMGKLPHCWSAWVDEMNNFQNYMIDYLFYSPLEQNHTYILKENNLLKNSKIAKLKEMFQNVIVSDLKMSNKIVSYCLSTLFNRVKIQKHNGERKTLFNNAFDKVVYWFYDIIFYVYSYAPTYNNTEKVISIIHMIEKEIGTAKSNQNLKGIIKRYSFIIEEGNFADIVNLILLCTLKRIDISIDGERKCVEKLGKEDNPMNFTAILLYDMKVSGRLQIKEKIEKKIEEQIAVMENMLNGNRSVFLYPGIWWVLIYFNCPYLDNNINNLMKSFLIDVKSNLNREHESPAAKIDVIDFYLDESYNCKIINWDIDEKNFYKNIVFKTFDRIIFNSKNSDNDGDVYEY